MRAEVGDEQRLDLADRELLAIGLARPTSFWPTSLRSRISSTRETPSRSRRERPNVSPTSRSRMRESGGMNVWSRSTIARRLVTRSLPFSRNRAATYFDHEVSLRGRSRPGDVAELECRSYRLDRSAPSLLRI